MALGLSNNAIQNRLRSGRLLSLDRGVYALGHAPASREARWMTAILRAGPQAVLSHWSAAALWGLIRQAPSGADLTYPIQRRPLPGITFHRAALPPDETTIRRALPVTTLPRALFDFAAIADDDRLERALHEAEAGWLADTLTLPDLLERYPRRRGVTRVRRGLARLGLGIRVTRSELEDRFISFVRDSGLPEAAVNGLVEAGGRRYEYDCVWRGQRLIVELDGHVYHRTRFQQAEDAARDRALSVAGWTVFRITWGQLERDPDLLRRQIAARLGLAE